MAATAKLDMMRDLSLTEEAGQLTELRRACSVFVPTNSSGVFDDALAALPAPGATITTSQTNLKLETRELRIADRVKGHDAYHVESTLTYRLQPSAADRPVRGGASLTQIETGKDRAGTALTVVDNGDTQCATIVVLIPRGYHTMEIVEATDTPEQVVKDWIGRVNSATWRGGDARTWMVTDAQYECVDNKASPKKYRFVYTFEYNQDTWDISYWYKVQGTGRPPSTLNTSNYKTLQWYQTAAFSSKFSTA